MKKKVVAVFLVGIALFMVSQLMWAHHSNALVDKDKIVTHVGKVTKLAFVHPHVAIYFVAKDAQGNEAAWFAGGGNPIGFRKEAGWTNKTLQPGDEIIVQGNPARDGSPIMSFRGLYRCSGERIPLSRNLDEPGEYITRVEMPKLDAVRVRALCAAAGLGGN